MANLKSSKKDIRRSERRHLVNQSVKSALKTYVKKVRLAADAGDETQVAETLRRACKMLDKATQRGIIHKNQAARRKSRIAAYANKAKTS
ncbi:MAG: 30S ribosomal protein S20 [Fimbriimonadaceae bacterium]